MGDMAPVGRIAAIVVGVVAAVGVAAAASVIAERAATMQPAAVTDPPTPSGAAELPLSLDDVGRRSLVGVVAVEAATPNNQEELGTGWIVDGRGDVVTNAHVVQGAVTIRLRDRVGQGHVGTVVAVDRVQDIAIIRSQDGLPGTALRSAGAAPVTGGVMVVALAAARATGQGEVTQESIGSPQEDVPVRGNPDLAPGLSPSTIVYHDMIRLDGSRIYPGNSGGPVLNADGSVIGMVTLASRAQPVAYAIPVGRIMSVVAAALPSASRGEPTARTDRGPLASLTMEMWNPSGTTSPSLVRALQV